MRSLLSKSACHARSENRNTVRRMVIHRRGSLEFWCHSRLCGEMRPRLAVERTFACISRMSKNLRSWLHRMLRIEPGRVPRLLCAESECYGVDLLSLVAAVVVFAAVFLWRYSWYLSIACMATAVLFVCLDYSFRSRERLARARLRRGECVYCGAKWDKGASNTCVLCGHTSDGRQTDHRHRDG